MKVKGKRTSVEYHDVEIDPETVLDLIYKQALPDGMDHIRINTGHWYRESGFDYHKREELYTKCHPASKEELEFFKALELVRKKVRELYR